MVQRHMKRGPCLCAPGHCRAIYIVFAIRIWLEITFISLHFATEFQCKNGLSARCWRLYAMQTAVSHKYKFGLRISFVSTQCSSLRWVKCMCRAGSYSARYCSDHIFIPNVIRIACWWPGVCVHALHFHIEVSKSICLNAHCTHLCLWCRWVHAKA